ncbi:hypothetical protein KR200_005272 [Drosophila serrata]|nr:hypothetical protein KR200_005272 [Drosophila serrata]
MKDALQPDNYNGTTNEEESSPALHAFCVLRNNNGNNIGIPSLAVHPTAFSETSGSGSMSGSCSTTTLSGSDSLWTNSCSFTNSTCGGGGSKPHEVAQALANSMALRGHENLNLSLHMNLGKGFSVTGHRKGGYQNKGELVRGDQNSGTSSNGEELRLSKIIRRLCNETNPTVALDLCGKLEQAVRMPINMGYMSCSFVWILESMLTLFKQCPPPVLEECSKILGVIGYLNRKSYPVFEEFILKNYKSSKRMQRYLILALRSTLSCDTKCELLPFSDKIMLLLKDFLETAENAESFMVISNTLVLFSASYREAFECHFTDVVDIIIGWQLEVSSGQPTHLKAHCAQVLEQLTPYFSKQIDFSYGLLAQFVEDITALDFEECETSAVRMGAFVGAFNTLLKCMARMQMFEGIPACESIVQLAVNHLVKIQPGSLLTTDAALVSINELLCICLLNGFGGLDADTLEELLLCQFEEIYRLSEFQRQSLLYLLLCTVRRLRARFPKSLVQLIFRSNPYLAELKRQKPGGKTYKLLLRTCQETLLIRNVPLLQQAYKHLVDDVDACVRQLQLNCTSDAERRASEEAGVLLVFHLAALAALAKQTSSIIGMYACQPSILELLLTNCRAQDMTLWSKYPAAHQTVLSLLVVHCQANHNFRTNSSLLRDQDLAENTSPTAHSFASILRFLDMILKEASQLAPHNLRILLQWTQMLLAECREKASLLMVQTNFQGICRSIACNAAKWTPLESGACMQTVLEYGPKELHHHLPELLVLYRDTALQQLQVLAPSGHHGLFAHIYAQLPLNVTLPGCGVSSLPGMTSRRLCVWQQRMSQCSAVRDSVFRDFVERLQQPDQAPLTSNSGLRDLFVRSCQVAPQDERQDKLSQCTRRCQRLATAWLQFEAARYCVDQRLRTTLGKPQDTFLGFEAIIMRHARLLSGCAKEAERTALGNLSLEELSNIQANLCMLLGFLDALEKLIYNAAEGSAFALRPPEKPVAAFFRLNNPTCQSWFNRIRIGVVIIAMHIHQPELVIRYAQQILLTQKSQDVTYSQAIVYMAWAWVSCREADSLRGLSIWARSKSNSSNNKSFHWLQYAADQAAGKRESALAGYRSLLADEETELEPLTRQFVLAQIMQCLQDTGQWSQLVEMKQLQFQRPEDRELNPFLQRSNVEVSALERLLARAEDATSKELGGALQQLSLWPSGWEETERSHASFSAVHIQRRTEDLVQHKLLEWRCLPDNVVGLLDTQWRDSLLNPSCDQRPCQELTLLRHIVQGVGGAQELCLLPLNGARRGRMPPRPGQNVSSAILMRCLAWTQLLRQHCAPGSWETLCLDAAAAAREEGNLQLSQCLLKQFFGQPLEEIAAQLATLPVTENPDLKRGYSELVKCLHLQQQQQQQQQQQHVPCGELPTSIDICASLCLNLQRSGEGADLLLNLSDWIATRSCSGLVTNQSPVLAQLLEQLPECPLTCGSGQPLAIPQAESLVARLVHASLRQRPNCEEALIAYGNWCYRWGKKIVDSGTVLTQTDVAAISQALDLPQPLDSEGLNELLQALSMEQPPAKCVEVCPEAARAWDDEAAKACLRRLPLLAERPSEVLDAVLRIWRRAIANTYDYYRDAARSYFQYLQVKSGHCGAVPAEGRFHVDDSNLVTTTLRLLRLIVKHASGLQEVLEQGLSNTPIAPWKVIIPQLFSRLNHHEPYVRKSVCALLCRLAESRPQLVIFPAVVGANREQQSDVEATPKESQPSTEDACCYGYLLNALSKQAPEAVQHVQLMVKELRRVCLLWDEYWIHSLANIYNTYVSRVSALATEFRPDDHEGKNNRFNAWRPQLLADLEALAALTARPPETSYERSFRKRFDAPIRATVEALRTRRYPEAWDKLKQLYHILQANMIRGTGSTLKMQSLSPVLCGIGRMRICMPGLDAHDEDEKVYIESVEGTVCVLPTKTKPKKVAFYGSNGQRYTFLFKGMEDLHLDERIMQFLSISNAIMACRSDAPGNGCYRAHHYSVIPLGPQSGLISWVDGVTPLFALYKKWQQRQPPQVSSKTGAGGGPGAGANATRRFTDLYYSKLSPLLAKHNLQVSDPRRQWPISALRQVLAELSQETPGDLLARELWCQAANAAEWRQSVRRYARCMSVMSMIGYVIGLGDRHLDNVLINLGSGNIVHIDYNVCFEKGRTLRIPEKVPFRLTQNLVHALGITGIEGSFRLGCEYVLKVMRKERETLLTLLEAFVYDPLVDWTINDDAQALRRSLGAKQQAAGGAPGAGAAGGYKKDKNKIKAHDWDTKRQHFLTKITHLQKYWACNQVEMQMQLQEMDQEVGNLQAVQAQRLVAEQELVELNQRSALIAEIKSLGTAIESHSFNTASLRHAVRRGHSEALAKLSAERQADYVQVQCLLTSYGQCLQPYHLAELHAQLLQLQMETERSSDTDTALPEILQLSGYDGMRGQLVDLLSCLDRTALHTSEHLQQYAAVMNFFPEQSHRQNLFVRFHDSYGAYIQNGGSSDTASDPNSSSSSIICTADVLGVAEALESAWLQHTCQLQEATQRYAAKQAITLGPTTPVLLAAIGQSGCSLLLLKGSLVRTLDRAGAAFGAYEQAALAAENEELLHHQLHFIHLVRSMCQGVLVAMQEDLYLGQVETLLTALLNLKQFFEYDLPASIYRLLLLQPNLGQLSAMCHLSAVSLGQLYFEATLERDQPTEELPAERRFMLSLQPAFEQFQQAASALNTLMRSIKVLLEDVKEVQAQQQLLASGLFKNRMELEDEYFFGLISETLEISRTCDVREMARPMLGLIHNLQSDCLAGLLPLLARNFYISMGPQCQPPTTNCSSLGDATQADHLCESLFISLQSDGAQQQEQAELALLNQQLELHTLAASAQYWAYSEALGQQLRGGHHIVSRPKLAALINEGWQQLEKDLGALQILQGGLESQLSHLQSQRSNWNRNHIDSFLRTEQEHTQQVAGHVAVLRQLTGAAGAVSRLEQVGDNPERQQMVEHLENWLAAHGQWQTSCARISAVEQGIVELLDPEGAIDPYWLENVQGLLEEQTCRLQREMAALECEQQGKHRFLCTLVKETQRLQEKMPRFHVRSLCAEAQAQGQGKLVPSDLQLLCGHLRDCQRLLQSLFQRLMDLRKDMCAERRCLHPVMLQGWRQQLQLIQAMAAQEVTEFFKSMDEQLRHVGETDTYETFTTQTKGASNLHEQKRNAYGVSVWKKIRMKLEGRDPDGNQRSTVAEQVDYAIREAINPDNLAVLYEGWTPWV